LKKELYSRKMIKIYNIASRPSLCQLTHTTTYTKTFSRNG